MASKSIFYKNYFYHELGGFTGDGGNGFELLDYNRLNDGRYAVILRENGITNKTINAMVALQNFDGKRLWTLHSLKIENNSVASDNTLESEISSSVSHMSFTEEFEVSTADGYRNETRTYEVPLFDAFDDFSFDGYVVDFLSTMDETVDGKYVVIGEYEHEYDGIVNLHLFYSSEDFSIENFAWGLIEVDTDAKWQSVVVNSHGEVLCKTYIYYATMEAPNQFLSSGYSYDGESQIYMNAFGEIIAKKEFEAEAERLLQDAYPYKDGI